MIRVDQGIPIWPPPAPQPDTNALPETAFDAHNAFDLESFAFASGPSSLPVPLFEQRKSNWCWAACMQMITSFFGNQMSQCEVAHVFFPTRNCCGHPSNCNEGLDPEDVKVTLRRDPLNVSSDRHDQPITSDAISSEIGEGRPIAAAIIWHADDGETRGGHLIVLKGWRFFNGRFYVKVNDPAFGRVEVPYSKLRSYYGPPDDGLDGVWEHTWTNIQEA